MAGRLLSTSLTAGSAAVPEVVGGEGVWFQLRGGRRVIDASNTAAPLGHGHPEMTAALRSVAGAPVVNEGWRWAERDQAAEDLVRIAFGDEPWVGAVRFFLSASEANDAALALAQALTGRGALATRERAYHGGAGLSRDLTVQPHWTGGLSTESGQPVTPPRTVTVHELPTPPGARISGQSDAAEDGDWKASAAAKLRDSAAVILDYSQGGIYHSDSYQDEVAAMARDVDCLWIADETVTGFGRVGGWFQFQKASSRPDIVTMGKCMAAGAAPGGAVVLSRRVQDLLEGRTWQTYSTFRGHVATVAALRAHLRISARDGLYLRAFERDAFMAERMATLAANHPAVARIDGRGLHWTIEMHGPDWRTWVGQEAEPLASRVAARALDHDVLLATSSEQTSVFLSPPLISSDGELERIFEALDAGLTVADEKHVLITA